MNNEELKKKIAQIIADYFCPQGNEHKKLWGDDRLCYSKMNFAECEWVTECTDALIAAGIGDVKTAQEIGASATAMAVLEAAKAEHRAARAERAFSKLVHEMYEHGIRPMCDEKFFTESRLKEAEKELAEERE